MAVPYLIGSLLKSSTQMLLSGGSLYYALKREKAQGADLGPFAGY
jgi:hypothetical protein